MLSQWACQDHWDQLPHHCWSRLNKTSSGKEAAALCLLPLAWQEGCIWILWQIFLRLAPQLLPHSQAVAVYPLYTHFFIQGCTAPIGVPILRQTSHSQMISRTIPRNAGSNGIRSFDSLPLFFPCHPIHNGTWGAQITSPKSECALTCFIEQCSA